MGFKISSEKIGTVNYRVWISADTDEFPKELVEKSQIGAVSSDFFVPEESFDKVECGDGFSLNVSKNIKVELTIYNVTKENRESLLSCANKNISLYLQAEKNWEANPIPYIDSPLEDDWIIRKVSFFSSTSVYGQDINKIKMEGIVEASIDDMSYLESFLSVVPITNDVTNAINYGDSGIPTILIFGNGKYVQTE